MSPNVAVVLSIVISVIVVSGTAHFVFEVYKKEIICPVVVISVTLPL
jgi:hypothetical protein